ncbi:MAG TPA: carboxypeptidase regulatory-like domain-containing protein [Terracidiphilus sp.]|nr:carboxypeptidase regulatory-like domain-containing protein [Terracidiphilus sp.]
MRLAKYAFGIAVVALACLSAAWAQENAELTGTVMDQTGAAIAKAKVTATNTATGDSRVTITTGTGLYDFPGLHIGTYTLQVEAPGFQSYKQTGIIMNVAATVDVNVSLKIGQANQTVTVAAGALHLQQETNEISNLITGQQITQLATNGRNVISLTTLGTGVSSMLPSFNGVTAQGSNFSISFNGMRPDHNDWLIDGGEVYDRGSGGKLDVMPSPDVLAEFKTLDSNYSPDYGISSGGTVTMVLKSGTRDFHGGLWEFNRNDAYDANYFFSKQSGLPAPELRLNIFGGDIGGPVFIPGLYNSDRKKTFFFWSEEWRKYIQGANPTATNTVPAADFPTAGADLAYVPWNEAAFPAGSTVCNPGVPAPCVPKTSDPAKLALYSADHLTPGAPFPGNVIPANLIDQNAVLFMNSGAMPKPNYGSTQYLSSPKQPTYVREDVVRIDHNINDKLHLMGHWIHDQMSQTYFPTQWSGDSYSTVGDVFSNPSWASVIKLTQTLSPTMLNETSFDVNGNTISVVPAGIYAQPSGWSAGAFFTGNNADNRLPQIGFGAPLGTTFTDIYWPWHNSFLDYQIRDDLSWMRGNHSFKFGFSYMRMDKNQQFQADTEGNYSFGADFSGDSYLNFLLGFADSYQQLQALLTDHWVNNTYSGYAMDDWRVTPRLTLNLGVRYDALPHVYEKNNRVANFVVSDFSAANSQTPDPSTGALNPAGPGFSQPAGASVPFYLNGMELAGVNGFPRGVVQNFYGTVQPRLGFALDLFGSGKTVLRGGAGLFFERIQGNDIYGADTNPPFAYEPQANDVYFSNPGVNSLTGSAASTPAFPASISSLAYYYPDPGTVQFSLGIQHQLAPSVIFETQYVGSAGWHQEDLRAIDTLSENDLTNRQAVANGANANLFRIFPGYSGITQAETGATGSYNSWQSALRMQSVRGLTLQVAYTWSHEIDIQSGDQTSFPIAGSSGLVSDPFDLKYDRGSGLFDRRNILNVNYEYLLPFFRGSSNGFARNALGGWEVSGVTQAESGPPVNASYSPDVLGLGGGTTNRPDKVGTVTQPKTQKEWFNTGAFATPTAPWQGGQNNGFGDAGKDSVVGPGLFNWNIALFKTIRFVSNESPRLQIRFESFNTFNHTEFQNIDTGFTDSNFGQVTNTYDPRVLQFGAKFLF